MSENQKRLTMKHIRAKPRRTEAPKRHFRHYMAKIRANFHPKSAHGSENPRDGIANPWDGSAIPWDGSAKPWDESARTSRPAAFPTRKGGATRPSALTVCHIAHKVCEACGSPGQASMCRGSMKRVNMQAGIPSQGRPRRGPAMNNRGWSAAEPAVRTRQRKRASKRRLCRKPTRA